MFQLPPHVPLLLHVDGRGLRHQRRLLCHREKEVLRHQLLVRLCQVCTMCNVGPVVAYRLTGLKNTEDC